MFFFLHHRSMSVFAFKGENKKGRKWKAEWEREQVLEWLMAVNVNSCCCPSLIKGMNFSFVSAVNNEHPAALRTPSIRRPYRGAKHLMKLLQTSYSTPPRQLRANDSDLTLCRYGGPSVVSARTFKSTKDTEAGFHTGLMPQVNEDNLRRIKSCPLILSYICCVISGCSYLFRL